MLYCNVYVYNIEFYLSYVYVYSNFYIGFYLSYVYVMSSINRAYFKLVKSTSPSLVPSQSPTAPHVQLFLLLLPQEHASPDLGVTFSVDALEQLQANAGRAPHEQVDFLAHTQLADEQVILLFQLQKSSHLNNLWSASSHFSKLILL